MSRGDDWQTNQQQYDLDAQRLGDVEASRMSWGEPPRDAAAQLPEYLKVSDLFSVSALNLYEGPVVVSQEAIFMTPLKHAFADLLALPFGVVGAIVAQAINRQGKFKSNHPLLIDYDRLPNTQDPDWPVQTHRGSIFVVPRTMVTGMQFQTLKLIRVETRSHAFSIHASATLKGTIVRDAIIRYGWPLA